MATKELRGDDPRSDNDVFHARINRHTFRGWQGWEAPRRQRGKVMSQNGLKKQLADNNDFSLTRMELIGLTLAANGYRAQEICTRLGVSEREIETLLFCAERKMGAKNRLHAIAIAVGQGLIGIEV
jgi:DNA-binding CsgD family transcriptional regulator